MAGNEEVQASVWHGWGFTEGDGGAVAFPSAGKEFMVHRDALRDICRNLHADLDRYQDGRSGSISDFQRFAPIEKTSFADYPAGRTLAQSCAQTFGVVNRAYTTFLTAYQNLIESISQAAENYEQAEGASTKASRAAYVE